MSCAPNTAVMMLGDLNTSKPGWRIKSMIDLTWLDDAVSCGEKMNRRDQTCSTFMLVAWSSLKRHLTTKRGNTSLILSATYIWRQKKFTMGIAKLMRSMSPSMGTHSPHFLCLPQSWWPGLENARPDAHKGISSRSVRVNLHHSMMMCPTSGSKWPSSFSGSSMYS